MQTQQIETKPNGHAPAEPTPPLPTDEEIAAARSRLEAKQKAAAASEAAARAPTPLELKAQTDKEAAEKAEREYQELVGRRASARHKQDETAMRTSIALVARERDDGMTNLVLGIQRLAGMFAALQSFDELRRRSTAGVSLAPVMINTLVDELNRAIQLNAPGSVRWFNEGNSGVLKIEINLDAPVPPVLR